ncbi:glycoside hydrolase family 57 protein [Calderihabitans maritimus]|uniref:Glycoside hydrolase n=1 Tax=Calderihabitans maritimus TaxID=1246530 RepID=A0A1Z5HQM4_9FIRM|nr:1,4-alpha-glucan branching protein domain-containing protein [Calderihabitans maritimus]GAW91580.1 hypothetical protein TherJR_0885 [Calderihabitans maritimus]
MTLGYLALILHAHLPFVRHPESEHYLEEKWLYEAITECYIPLIKVFERLIEDEIDFRLTMSLTPPLLSMLNDRLLQQRYLKHLNLLRELAEKEVKRTRHQKEFHEVARMYRRLFEEAYTIYHEKYNDNLIQAFKKFQDLGKLELITCAATHGYLPLVGLEKEIIQAQLKVAVDLHTRLLGRPPTGIWLPECGYRPGLEPILREFGLNYFIVDTHGILYATPRPRYAIFAPLNTQGVAAFGRDVETSLQVWSATEGYPGDFDYREFYRDIGYDLDFDYIKPYIHPDGIRVHTGIKYYRITGRTDYKEPYVPSRATEKAAIHAGNFMFNREKQIEYLAHKMDRPPVIVSPYDAELFGHWWFEGPQWLDFLLRKIACDQNVFRLITPGDYLKLFPHNQPATPCASSWGENGYNDVWLNGSNDWIYRHLHEISYQMIRLARQYTNPTSIEQRALNQAAREVLLAQSSDWAFIMKTGTMVDYAVRRTKLHVGRFLKLHKQILEHKVDENWLKDIEEKDNIFPDIDYRVFAYP